MNPRDSRRRFAAAAICALTVLVAAEPAAAVNPAVNEYSLNFPNAKGKSYPGAEAPSVKPSELGPIVGLALSQSPDGKALAAIATSPELGAPSTASGAKGAAASVGGGGSETPSLPTAASSALDDLPVILVLLGLGTLVGFIGVLARPRRTSGHA